MIKMIAFDFDGTLADSVDFCLAVFDRVLKKYLGENAPDREAIYQNFGMNEPGVLRHFIGRTVPEAETDFYQLHRELHPVMTPAPYPGIVELLDELKSRKIPLAILTGRSDTTCRISMEYLDLKKYFITFRTGSPERNDKTAQLKQLAADYDLALDELIYVGDAVSDATACHAAQVKCLSAAWAKSARIPELEKINPGLVFTGVAKLQKYLVGQLDKTE